MAAKTQPTREEWKQIEKDAMSMFVGARLLIDGYEVKLDLGRITKTRLAICIWVDGAFKGEWCKPGHDIARRFYQTKTVYLFNQKEINKAVKELGKKRATELGYYNSFESVAAYWSSFARLKAHLIKNNDSIVWLTESAKEAQAA